MFKPSVFLYSQRGVIANPSGILLRTTEPSTGSSTASSWPAALGFRRADCGGTTTWFVALDIAFGNVLAECKPHRQDRQFLGFPKRISETVPATLDAHLILDHYTTHKHTKARVWLAARPRFHLHFTPTYWSWLNKVERWFGLITHRPSRRGSFKTVKELIAKINHFVQHYNRNSKYAAFFPVTASVHGSSAGYGWFPGSPAAPAFDSPLPRCFWQLTLAHLRQLTLAHLWQLAGQV
jgi:putative transposase